VLALVRVDPLCTPLRIRSQPAANAALTGDEADLVSHDDRKTRCWHDAEPWSESLPSVVRPRGFQRDTEIRPPTGSPPCLETQPETLRKATEIDPRARLLVGGDRTAAVRDLLYAARGIPGLGTNAFALGSRASNSRSVIVLVAKPTHASPARAPGLSFGVASRVL
jgi:hypothetical protein